VSTDVAAVDVPFADALWPGGGHPTSYLPLCRAGTLRSLLPAESPLVLRRALARSNGPESRGRHLARAAVAAAAAAGQRAGARRGLLDAPGGDLQDRIAEIAGTAVSLAIHFGPPRANRKPVIQAFDHRGRLVAVAKLGVGDLTAELVIHEAGVLAALHRGPTPATEVLEVPGVLGLTAWGGRPLLVQAALQVPGRHVVPAPARRRAAERRVGRLRPTDGHTWRRATVDAYAADLRDRLGALPEPAPVQEYLDALDRVADTVDLAAWPSAPWHGDWSPQNVAASRAGVAAWDWERFAPDRPLGFDTAHFRLQELLRRPPATQPGVCLLREAPTLLADWHGQDQPERTRSVAVLLLLELTARYLGDGQLGTGSPGSTVETWVGPALREFASRRGSR
jgi:hypothetical protein